MSQIIDLDINKLKTKDIAGIMKSVGKLIMIPILFSNLKNKSKNAKKVIEQVMGVKTNTFAKCQIKYLHSMATDFQIGKFYTLNESQKIKFLNEYEQTPNFQKFIDCMVNVSKNKKMKDDLNNYFEKRIKSYKLVCEASNESKKDVVSISKRLDEDGYKNEAKEMLNLIKEFDNLCEKSLREEKLFTKFYKDNKKKIDELKKDQRKYIAFLFLRIINKIYKV